MKVHRLRMGVAGLTVAALTSCGPSDDVNNLHGDYDEGMATIGPAGGTLRTGFLGAVTLAFPAGAVSTDTQFKVTSRTQAPASQRRALGLAYEFSPPGPLAQRCS